MFFSEGLVGFVNWHIAESPNFIATTGNGQTEIFQITRNAYNLGPDRASYKEQYHYSSNKGSIITNSKHSDMVSTNKKTKTAKSGLKEG